MSRAGLCWHWGAAIHGAQRMQGPWPMLQAGLMQPWARSTRHRPLLTGLRLGGCRLHGGQGLGRERSVAQPVPVRGGRRILVSAPGRWSAAWRHPLRSRPRRPGWPSRSAPLPPRARAATGSRARGCGLTSPARLPPSPHTQDRRLLQGHQHDQPQRAHRHGHLRGTHASGVQLDQGRAWHPHAAWQGRRGHQQVGPGQQLHPRRTTHAHRSCCAPCAWAAAVRPRCRPPPAPPVRIVSWAWHVRHPPANPGSRHDGLPAYTMGVACMCGHPPPPPPHPTPPGRRYDGLPTFTMGVPGVPVRDEMRTLAPGAMIGKSSINLLPGVIGDTVAKQPLITHFYLFQVCSKRQATRWGCWAAGRPGRLGAWGCWVPGAPGVAGCPGRLGLLGARGAWGCWEPGAPGAAGCLGRLGLLGARGAWGCWADVLLGAWGCWAAGLLGCWAAGLLGAWGCWAAGAGMRGWLRCCACERLLMRPPGSGGREEGGKGAWHPDWRAPACLVPNRYPTSMSDRQFF
jgi:hypothetical protein